MKDAGDKVFLILDNLSVHHSKPVKAWLAENQEKIECYYFPGYSPELNQEERLDSDLKQAIGSKADRKCPLRTQEKLRAAANDPMTMLEEYLQCVAPCLGKQPVQR